MLFKSPKLALELSEAHPDIRKVLGELEHQCREWGLREFTLTEVDRTQAENEAIYTAAYIKEGSTRAVAAKRAKGKRSRHCEKSAVDFRNHAWTKDERAMVEAWLRKRCPREDWEVLFHVVADKPHFHLARKDEAWRQRVERGRV